MKIYGRRNAFQSSSSTWWRHSRNTYAPRASGPREVKDLTTQFLAALDAIRGGKLDCAFQIPQPTNGQMLDFLKVNVSVKTASGTTDLYYVAGAAQCDPTTGGWYYNADPQMGGTPTQIIACPTSCTAFQGVNNASVEIALGCLTKTIVK